ncbi:MAG: phosphopeptide-binding protein [Chitinophagales bacterium]|nr:phosphopeptide-binding protein [Chitinophagales bacterium]
MKKILACSIIFFIAILFFISCRSAETKTKQKAIEDLGTPLITMKDKGITLKELYSPESFADASLQLMKSSNLEELDNNKIHLNFDVKNYTLGEQTDRTGIATCANSGQGQHIHCIVDNQPYTAHYTNDFSVDTKDGQHVVLCFLSRSYHESVKNPNAYILTSIITGKSRYTAKYANPRLNDPHLFYSRPKGTYVGEEVNDVLLDFFIVNCNLSEKGYKVKAQINDATFLITKWVPFFIEGMKMGENTITLTLLDKDNNVVDSQFNPVTRTVTLKEKADN